MEKEEDGEGEEEERIGHLVDANEREQSPETPGFVRLKEKTFVHPQTIKEIKLRHTLSKPMVTQPRGKDQVKGLDTLPIVKTSEQIKVVPVNPFSCKKMAKALACP